MTQLVTTSSKKCFLHLASRSPYPLVFLLPHQLLLLNPLLVPSYFPISQGSDLPDLSMVTGGTAQDLSPTARCYCLTLAIASCGTPCIPPRSYWLYLLEGPLNPIHAPLWAVTTQSCSSCLPSPVNSELLSTVFSRVYIVFPQPNGSPWSNLLLSGIPWHGCTAL